MKLRVISCSTIVPLAFRLLLMLPSSAREETCSNSLASLKRSWWNTGSIVCREKKGNIRNSRHKQDFWAWQQERGNRTTGKHRDRKREGTARCPQLNKDLQVIGKHTTAKTK